MTITIGFTSTCINVHDTNSVLYVRTCIYTCMYDFTCTYLILLPMFAVRHRAYCACVRSQSVYIYMHLHTCISVYAHMYIVYIYLSGIRLEYCNNILFARDSII